MHGRRYPDLIPAARFTRGTALVVAPHPDDEVAVCGGMVLHHVDAGNAVEVAFLTDGARGSWKDSDDADYIALREEEARAACKFQGTRTPRFLHFPDGKLLADSALVTALKDLVLEVDPYVVYCTSLFEIHGDHVNAARALLLALEAAEKEPLVLFGEVGAPVWANALVDITPVMERKVEALNHYASQLSANDYVPPLRGLNQYRTVNIDMKGIEFVEAYLMGRPKGLRRLAEAVEALGRMAEEAADIRDIRDGE